MIMAAAEASTCSFFPPLFSSALNDQKNNDDLQKGPTLAPDLSSLILIHTFLCHFEDQMRK